MNKYEIRITKPNDQSFAPLTGSACGETFDLAIEHANFWEKDGHWIDPDCQIEVLSVTPIDYYPYTYEDAFRFAVENKIKVAVLDVDLIVLQQGVDLDQVLAADAGEPPDLIVAAGKAAPAQLHHADAGRGHIAGGAADQHGQDVQRFGLFVLDLDVGDPQVVHLEQNGVFAVVGG